MAGAEGEGAVAVGGVLAPPLALDAQKVGLAVAVEVAGDDGVGTRSGSPVLARGVAGAEGEGAVAVRSVLAPPGVAHPEEVRLAVAVEVTRHDGVAARGSPPILPGGVASAQGECAVAIGGVLAPPLALDAQEVALPVAIEVAGDARVGARGGSPDFRRVVVGAQCEGPRGRLSVRERDRRQCRAAGDQASPIVRNVPSELLRTGEKGTARRPARGVAELVGSDVRARLCDEDAAQPIVGSPEGAAGGEGHGVGARFAEERDRHSVVGDRVDVAVVGRVTPPVVVDGVAVRVAHAPEAPAKRAADGVDRGVDALDAVLLPHRPRVGCGVEGDAQIALDLGAVRATHRRARNELLTIQQEHVRSAVGGRPLPRIGALDDAHPRHTPADPHEAVAARRVVAQRELRLDAAEGRHADGHLLLVGAVEPIDVLVALLFGRVGATDAETGEQRQQRGGKRPAGAGALTSTEHSSLPGWWVGRVGRHTSAAYQASRGPAPGGTLTLGIEANG